jgi:aminoglycoside phosphotransferase (APT) family kinase protein
VDSVEIVVAHAERTTLRVGDVFLKVDADPGRIEREAAAMALTPLPTPEVLWRKPQVLALAALTGVELGRLGEPSQASSAAWIATGALVRRLHETPPPPWPPADPAGTREQLDTECRWLVDHGHVPAAVVERNRRIADTVFTPRPPVFVHGDLQIRHVFVDGDDVTGIIDWSEAGPGDAHHDIATLTLGHEERLDEVLTGYGRPLDVEVIRGWWSLRSLTAIRWLMQHGFDPSMPGGEIDVLRARM